MKKLRYKRYYFKSQSGDCGRPLSLTGLNDKFRSYSERHYNVSGNSSDIWSNVNGGEGNIIVNCSSSGYLR